MECKVNLPYPVIGNIKKDVTFAKLLMHSYAGDISEETAIHQYSYQSFLLFDNNLELSKIFSRIAIVEMEHLKILGHLIKKLGVYPVFLDPVVDCYEFFTTKYVSYSTNVKDMLLDNIKAEKKAISNYNSLIQVTDNESIKKILGRIVLDERLHLQIFEKLLDDYS